MMHMAKVSTATGKVGVLQLLSSFRIVLLFPQHSMSKIVVVSILNSPPNIQYLLMKELNYEQIQ